MRFPRVQMRPRIAGRAMAAALFTIAPMFVSATPAAAEPSTCLSEGVDIAPVTNIVQTDPGWNECSFVYKGGPIRWAVKQVVPPPPYCVPTIFNSCDWMVEVRIRVDVESPIGLRTVGSCEGHGMFEASCSGLIEDPDVQFGETLHCVSFRTRPTFIATSAGAYRCSSGF